ncbi:histidine kinase [Streptomyces sp. NPDC093109]|uniref:sensor histidine kinase n=1 Tax=Streptomyces sp. NPDC093109 TaxID=3154977 RepID=UPI00344C94D5
MQKQNLIRNSVYGITYGVTYAALGAALSLPPLTAALIAGLGLRWAGFGAVLAVLLAVGGFPGPVRGWCVSLANRFLRTSLPAPTAPATREAGSPWPNRWRTSAWLLAHVTVGWLVLTTAGLVLLAVAVTGGAWAAGGDRVQFFGGDVVVRPGWPGAWVVLAAVAGIAVAAQICASGAAVLRALAPALLGQSPAERLAAAEARTRELAHRNRLARELHDSIGHTLTASTIQAAVASELMTTDPARARRALTSIEESSRSALDDLDHVLGVLREAPSTASTTTPAPPTLTDLPALLARVRQTGTDVRADLPAADALTRVPAAVSREAYRIVQEGLTNALRHGAGTPVSVTVSVTVTTTEDGDRLSLELANKTTEPHPRHSHGHGLTGMSERVRLLEGEFHAGPTADGRWTLTAALPLRSAR